MSLNPELHKKLIARQSKEELKRKALKAEQRSLYTQEWLDYADREAEELYQFFKTFE